MKINPVGAELFYADGETDGRRYITKLIVPFHNFANVAKKDKRYVGRERIAPHILILDTMWE